MTKILSLLSALLCTFIWGTTFIAQDTGMDDIGPFTFNAVRFFVGFLAVAPLAFIFEKNNIKRSLNKDKKYFVKTPKTIMKIKKKKEIVKPITPPIEIVIEETVLEEIVNDQEVKPVEEIQVVVHTKEEPIQTKVVETTNDNKYLQSG